MQSSNYTNWNDSLKANGAGKCYRPTSKAGRCTGLAADLSAKGFVFSLDALVAVIMVTGAMFVFLNLETGNSVSPAQTSTIVDDTVFALEKTGFLIQTLDTNGEFASAALIRQEIIAYLPKGFDANASVTSYVLDRQQCAASQTFGACFPDSNKFTGTAGGEAKDSFISGRKYFIRKEAPGDCNVTAELAPFDPFETGAIDWLPKEKKHGEALFTPAYFDHGEIHIEFDVSVDPSDSVSCDENVSITLTASVESGFRKPIDIMIVMDRSRPPEDYGPVTEAGTDKNVMTDFLRNANWTSSQCSQSSPLNDCIGLGSYDSIGRRDRNLQSARNSVESAIKNLPNSAAANNAIAEGIEAANDELIGNGRDEADKFIVVLSDDPDNSDSADLDTEAQRAVDNNIVVFAVGTGPNANPGDELRNLAETTGGDYYSTVDGNSLQELYSLIANRISESVSGSAVSVPTIDGATLIDLGGGILSDNNIVFDAGTLDPNNPWSATYVLNFPCSNANVCGIDALTFPGAGSFFTYTDSNGVVHEVDFNASTTLDFKVRDLTVDITGGEVIGANDISIDVRVENAGELDANSVPLKFYFENPGVPPIVKEFTVKALCSTETPACTEFSETFAGVGLDQEGRVFATINDDNSLSECPLGNEDNILCEGGPDSQVFVVDYTIWRS